VTTRRAPWLKTLVKFPKHSRVPVRSFFAPSLD
jgi:hypothetical protein